jgi:hypothetical protein
MEGKNDEAAGGAFGRLHEGMHVVDATGEDIGTVDYFEMGNPEAVTTAGNELRTPGGLIGSAANAIAPGESEPDVPEPLRSRLRRGGFIKIDGPGLLASDRYVSTENVSEVTQDRVRLNVRKDQLPKEH